MKTKYKISIENTYLDAINSPPENLIKDMVNTSTHTDCINTDANNNPLMFSSLYYECRLETENQGEMRLYAGHHKHAFATCDRPITCKVIKGQMKVKCGAQKWSIFENNTIKLKPNSKYFVKNNSLRNECIVSFTLDPL